MKKHEDMVIKSRGSYDIDAAMEAMKVTEYPEYPEDFVRVGADL